MQLMNFGMGLGSNGGNAPWITDIHNGIVNPNFTYTGGQAIVPDEDGILRRTPAGYPAVEGGAWSGTNWLPPTAGTTRTISTRKGSRQIQTADTFEGMLVEPAMTNKLTCMKSNPTATTNITLTGDGAAVLSVVTDPATYLSGAGLADICTTNKIYKWDNSLGVGAAIAVLGGTTNNVNVHSYSMYIIAAVGAGTVYLRTDAADAVAIPATFQRLKKENVTPDTTARQVRIAIDAGAIVYFILPQLEESPFCTSPIAPAADTAAAQTRTARVVSASTAGVFPSSGQDFAVFMRVIPEGSLQAAITTKDLFSTAIDGDNYWEIFIDSASIYQRARVSGVNTLISIGYTHAVGISADILSIRTAMGMAIKVRIGAGEWSAWTINEAAAAKVAAIIGSTYQVGAKLNISQFAANFSRTAIIAMPPKATLAEYQSWIEDELTLRGLI